MLTIDTIVMIHHGSNKAADRLTVIVRLAYHVSDGVDDVACGGYVALARFDLEVAHLPVKGRRHLSYSKRHWEVGKESDAVNLKVGGEREGMNNGSWPDEK